MIRTALVITIALVLASAMPAEANDLYRVTISSSSDARSLSIAKCDPLISVSDGYLVLSPQSTADLLRDAGLQVLLIDDNISRSDIAFEQAKIAADPDSYPIIYEDSGIRLVRVDGSSDQKLRPSLKQLGRGPALIEYRRKQTSPAQVIASLEGLQELLDEISQDSLYAYVSRLEAFTHRLAGTDSNYAARDWIESKFASFGYTDVAIDPFEGSQLWDRVPVPSYNVIATKPGTYFSDFQIVIGAHFDAVPDCPGADDNGTGTAAVLEIARVLQAVDIPMTIKFITFDSEESWMWGSYHYVDEAMARGDKIVLMVNPDMIGHYNNDQGADLYHGAETAYALLWQHLADSLGFITEARLSGSTASDHLPFQEVGIPVIFVQELNFSTEYHQPSDSTTYIDFEYMTRMTKATLATIFASGHAPPPVASLEPWDVGDGQSLYIEWVHDYPSLIDHFLLQWGTAVTINTSPESITVPGGQSNYTINGLSEGTNYILRVYTVTSDGTVSVVPVETEMMPLVNPRVPGGLIARPVREGIRLQWRRNNAELDFDHYVLIRDNIPLPVAITDSVYIDPHIYPDTFFYSYQVEAVDTDGNQSGSLGQDAASTRAAALLNGRMLAINRSSSSSAARVDEWVTREFFDESLGMFGYTYRGDTAALNASVEDTLKLVDLLNYEVVVVGGEGRRDELLPHNLLDTLAYYLSIGGKVIVFGRSWEGQLPDTLYYDTPSQPLYTYSDWFHLDAHVLTAAKTSDLVGAHSQISGYPDLVWDSLATIDHAGSPTGVTGIPFASFDQLRGTDPEVIYTYQSLDPGSYTEGEAIGWRYLGPDYQYVYFEFPLTFMERESAVVALRQAVADLKLFDPSDCCTGVRGNANHDWGESVTISDVTFLVAYLFGIPIGPAPICLMEGNVNGDVDETVNISDITFLIDYLFGIPIGPAPPPCP